MTPAECGFGSSAILATQVLRIITRRPTVRHIITLITIPITTTMPAVHIVRITVASMAEDITVVDSMEAAAVGTIDSILNRLTSQPHAEQLTGNEKTHIIFQITRCSTVVLGFRR